MFVVRSRRMQETRCSCHFFSLILIFLLDVWFIKNIGSYPMQFFNSWTKPPLLPPKLTHTRRIASGIPISYRLDAWSQYENPEEGAEREGDIYESPQSRKTIAIEKYLLWPNGIVKYYVASSIVNEPMKFAMLMDAMHIIMAKTCVKFVRIHPGKDGQFPVNDWVNITGDKSGCFSNVGRNAFGPAILNLNVTKCFHMIGHAIHEMLHILGVHHEHMRPDRDEHITIIWNNIKDEHTFNFDILNVSTVTTHGLPYDYDSVMHYSMTAFSMNKSLPTIIPMTSNVEIGQRNHLSHYDVQKLLITYNCNTININNLHNVEKRKLVKHSKLVTHKYSDYQKLPHVNETALKARILATNKLGDNIDSKTQINDINRMFFSKHIIFCMARLFYFLKSLSNVFTYSFLFSYL